jgi:phage/plasmid primase-like uncharacterized protein
MSANAREIAALVPMPRLLEALGFRVNEKTRRGPCLLHGGKNPTAFAWREDGRWCCYSCGAGGNHFTLIRAVRNCSFPDAVGYLAGLAGVEYLPGKQSRPEFEAAAQRRERAARAAWRVRDEVVRLRGYYANALHRIERLQRRVGHELLTAECEATRMRGWHYLARLAPAATFFLAAFCYLKSADSATLARFALASTADRRTAILGAENVNAV